MYKIDLYKQGIGVIKRFPDQPDLKAVLAFIEDYLKDNNVHIIAKEHCGDAHWNYLSNGTEIDYCLE